MHLPVAFYFNVPLVSVSLVPTKSFRLLSPFPGPVFCSHLLFVHHIDFCFTGFLSCLDYLLGRYFRLKSSLAIEFELTL